MGDIIKPGLTLFVIALVAAALLGFVNVVTAPAIAQNKIAAKQKAMAEVLPQTKDNSFSGNYILEPMPDTGVTGYNISLDGQDAVGFAITVREPAYSGVIELLVGVDIEGIVTGVKLVEHNETPGLGANADKPAFRDQFIGKSGQLTVTKNGQAGQQEIDAVTSATITSKAVTKGVNDALAFYELYLLTGGGAR